MAIHHDLTVKGDTLEARAWGFDESLEDVQSYGLAIIQACREQGVTRVLCDERELEYRLNTFEHYEAAEFIAQQVPAVAKAAIVCHPQSLSAVDLYEDVAVNRGLMLRIFTDIDQAWAWLEDTAPSGRAPGAAAPVASAPSSDAHRPPLPAVPRRRAVLSMMRPTVFLALLYFMLGGLGLALSHGGHLPLWPAAGLALAIVLHRGRRALPGIGLGALLVLSMQRLLTDPTPHLGWLTSLCLTFGAMLQAGIGAWLCRKHLEPGWESLERPRDVLQLLFWGGGIAPAIATSFNFMAMTLAGALSSETAGLTWWQGFVADALGIALFTPLGLFLLRRRVEAPGESGKASAARAALLAGSLLWPLYLFSMATPATMAQGTWGEALALPLDARRDSPSRRPHGAVLTGFLAALGLQLLLLRELGRIQAHPPRREELDGALRHTLQLFNDSPLPAWVYDADSLSFLMVNEKAMALYGWPREDWPGLTLRDIVPAEDLLAYLAPAERSTTNPSGMERRHRRQDGTLITVRVNRSLTWHGERQARLEFIEDITERQKVERALIESEKRFRRLFEDSQQAILLFDNFHCIAANPAALAILRAVQREHIVGSTLAQLSPPAQPNGRATDETAAEMTRIALEEGAHAFEWELLRTNGEPFMAQVLMTVIHQAGRNLLHVVLIDITDQKKAHEQIEYMTFHDALTGLPNRILGRDRLMHDIARAEGQQTLLAVIYLDVDKFKFINDTYGHSLGDHLLQALARRLAQGLRGEDTLCRLSGDEFMIILPDMRSQVQVARVIESIQQQLAEPFELGVRRLNITLSLGVAFYPQDGANSETLMLNADMALYEAKKAGANSCRLFTPAINDELTRFVQTRNALRVAIEQQTFELYYQPQMDLRTGRMVGVEALLRWRQADGSLLMPGGFISVAEESGLIVPIGRWVLRQACRQAAHWRARGLFEHAVVAVNLSAVQFRQEGFAEEVLAALEESGLDAAGLELELTESLLLENASSILAMVERWKEHGIRLSLDDFGTGYSSLAYLKQFRVDKLKIDRSFIKNLTTNPDDRAIVRAMVDLARGLNMRTIAEGVEEAATVDALRDLGCDEMQGYWYSRPLTAAELETWRSHAGPKAPAPMDGASRSRAEGVS